MWLNIVKLDNNKNNIKIKNQNNKLVKFTDFPLQCFPNSVFLSLYYRIYYFHNFSCLSLTIHEF